MKQPLTQIAYTTTWQGGVGVIYARNLLGLEVDDVVQHLRMSHAATQAQTPEVQDWLAGFNPLDNLTLMLFDAGGRLIFTGKACDYDAAVSALKSGIYTIKVFDSAGMARVKKVFHSK